MTEEVKRNYLEINSLQDLKEGYKPSEDYSLSLIDPVNFQLNKFFIKQSEKNINGWKDCLGQRKNGLLMFHLKKLKHMYLNLTMI